MTKEKAHLPFIRIEFCLFPESKV